MKEKPENDQPEKVKKPVPPLPPPPGEEPLPQPEQTPDPVPSQPSPVILQPSPFKSPPLAAFLSVLFPGLGHLYCWSYERAFMIWASLALAIFMVARGWWPMSFVIAFIYFFGIFDSFREAQCFELGDEEPRSKTKSSGDGRLMFGVFLAVVAAVVLIDKFDLFDLYWLYEWWPVPIFLVGVYFIFAALRERFGQREKTDSFTSGYEED